MSTYVDLEGIVSWEVWVRDNEEKTFTKFKSFNPSEHDKARICKQAVSDAVPDSEVQLRAKFEWTYETEMRQVIARENAGHKKRRGHAYWSADYHAMLVKIEGIPEENGMGVFVSESLGDEFGDMGKETSFSVSMNDIPVKYSGNMTAQVIASVRRQVDELEQAYREAGLLE